MKIRFKISKKKLIISHNNGKPLKILIIKSNKIPINFSKKTIKIKIKSDKNLYQFNLNNKMSRIAVIIIWE